MSTTPRQALTRRQLLTLGGGTGALLALTACSSGAVNEAEPETAQSTARGTGRTLSVWIMEGANPDARPFFREVSAAFKASTGADLTVEYVPWIAAHDKFNNAIAGNTTPDLAEVGTTWTPEFAAAGALKDLTDDIKAAGLPGTFVKGLLDAGTLGGKVYGVPWYAGVRSVIYRTDLFTSAGLAPPANWNDIVTLGQKLKAAQPRIMPFPVPSAVHHFTPFVWGAGGQIATPSGDTWKSALDSPASIAGTTFYTELATKHGFSSPAANTWNEKEVGDAFARGEAAMSIAGSWTPPSILQANPDLRGRIGAFPIPGKEGGIAPSFLGGSHLAIFENSKNQDLAWALIQLMTTGEFTQKWSAQSGYFPAVTDLLAKIEHTRDPLVAPFAVQMNQAGTTVPVSPQWGAVEGAKVMSSMLQSVLSGKAKPAEACIKAAAEMNRILAR